jgi:hypothetical protein
LIAIDPKVSPQEIVDALWTCRDTVTENEADPSYIEGYRDGVAEATELAGKLLPMLGVEPKTRNFARQSVLETKKGES